MKRNHVKYCLLSLLLSGASLVPAQTRTVFEIDRDTDPLNWTANYLGTGYGFDANSPAPPLARVDSATLGGTSRTLAQVDVTLSLIAGFGGETVDVQMMIFKNPGGAPGAVTFEEVWASEVTSGVSFDDPIQQLSFTPTTPVTLPDTLYYSVVLSNFQWPGGDPFDAPAGAGPMLGAPGASPTSEYMPDPSLPTTAFWILNADKATYTEFGNAQNRAVAVSILTVVPEPGVLGSLVIGSALLVLLHRMRSGRKN